MIIRGGYSKLSVFITGNISKLINGKCIVRKHNIEISLKYFIFFKTCEVIPTAAFFLERNFDPVPRQISTSKPQERSQEEPGILWRGCVYNPTIPDPAFDRNFPVFWMETVEKLIKIDPKKQGWC